MARFRDRVVPPSFCKHRRTIIKRWIEHGKLMVIQRCRYCDDWTKKAIDFAKEMPTMHTQKVIETGKTSISDKPDGSKDL